MRQRSGAAIQVVITTYIAEFDPNSKLTLSRPTGPGHGDRVIELYEGQPATRLRLNGGVQVKIGLGGIRKGCALLYVVRNDGFTTADQYVPSEPYRQVYESVVSVRVGGSRDIIVNWDDKTWLFRLICKKL